jgi:hypothetical protein
MPPETFGHRFLTEFRRLGGSTRDWPDQAVTLLDQADRRQFIDALTKASSSAASKLAIAAHTAEPETLAKPTVDRNEKDGGAVLMALVLGVMANTGN